MKGIKRLVAFVLCFCIISSYTVVSAAGMGDVNGDGKILTNDAISVLRCATGHLNLSALQRYRADIDGDGVLSTKDVVAILRQCADIDPEKNLSKISHITPYSSQGSSTKQTFCEITTPWCETYPQSVSGNYSNPLYTPLPKGTFDYVTKTDDSFVYLRSGGKVTKNEVKVFSGYSMPYNTLSLQNTAKYSDRATSLYLASKWKVPFTVTLAPQSYETGYNSRPYNNAGDKFTASYMDIKFYNTTSVNEGSQYFQQSDVINGTTWFVDSANKTATLRVYLKNTGAFYGYKAYYNDKNYLVFEIKEDFSSLKGKVIELDPGHGGDDPGACAGGLRECDLAYKIALQLKTYLENAGATVVFSYNKSASPVPDIDARRIWAEDNAPDMFIAIHLNSATSTSVKGSSVYYYKNYSGPLAKCISTSLPNAVRNGVGYGLENDGCHFYPFRVTRIETCPSVLVEVGYISNASERAMMNTANGQKYIAKGIYDGIVNYANM